MAASQRNNLTKFLASIFAPKAVSDVLDNMDPKALGLDVGRGLKNAIVAQITLKAYKTLRPRFLAWIDALYVSFRKGLFDD